MSMCLVPGCRSTSRSEFEGRKITFHRFPKDEEVIKTWASNLNIVDVCAVKKNSTVCSFHFRECDFIHTPNGSFLHSDAIPIGNQQQQQFEYVDDECIVDEHHINLTSSKIYSEHSYSIYSKSVVAVTKQDQIIQELKAEHSQFKQTIQKLENELKLVKDQHKKDSILFGNLYHLSPFLQEFIVVLLKHHKTNSYPKEYSPEFRRFALSVHYHSPETYRYVRSVFNKCCPHPQTIALWYRTVDGTPGFTCESLRAITDLVKQTPYKIVVNVVVDGMALRKHIHNNGNENIGYTDFGGVIPRDDDNNQLAKESLIYMAVGVNVAFKIPFGYFLINGIAAKPFAYLTETGLTLLIEAGVSIGSLTWDGLRSNFAMAELLGCNYKDINNLVVFFEVEGQKVFTFPDVCHMIKLARNFMSEEADFLDGNGHHICWKYIKALNVLQTSIGLNLGNKLRNLHVHFQNQVMKVYLATQLFSNSVADALEFCNVTLKLPDFKNCEGTVEFIRVMNDVFDIFNSRNMTDTGYKKPINENNYNLIMSRLEYVNNYVRKLTYVDKTPLYVGHKKTFVVGILILIKSLKEYFDEYVRKKKLLSYIPTYTQLQDSCEIFNCTMRSFGGYNTNPTAKGFQSAYKKALIHVEFKEKVSGNCYPLERIPILQVTSAQQKKSSSVHTQYITDEEIELSFQNAISFNYSHTYAEPYYCVISHISGFVARRLKCILKCECCTSALISENCDLSKYNSCDTGPDDDMDLSNNLNFERNMPDGDFDINYDHDEYMCFEDNLNFDENISCDSVESFGIHFDTIRHYDYAVDTVNTDDLPQNHFSDDEEIEENAEDDNPFNVILEELHQKHNQYFDLIKQKDRNSALLHPSESLYKVAILSDRVFRTALKESGGKVLRKKYTIKKMLMTVHRLIEEYSNKIFNDLSLHFENAKTHKHALTDNIARFYLNIRTHYLNKIISSNNGRRQKNLHITHFEGM